jgi:hypothetical protein
LIAFVAVWEGIVAVHTFLGYIIIILRRVAVEWNECAIELWPGSVVKIILLKHIPICAVETSQLIVRELVALLTIRDGIAAVSTLLCGVIEILVNVAIVYIEHAIELWRLSEERFVYLQNIVISAVEAAH